MNLPFNAAIARRHDHVGESACWTRIQTRRAMNHPSHGRQHLPLHRLCADRCGDPTRCASAGEGDEEVSAEKKTDFHVVNHSLRRRDGRVK